MDKAEHCIIPCDVCHVLISPEHIHVGGTVLRLQYPDGPVL